MNERVNDALGNPIVIGAEYCCTMYGQSTMRNHKVVGTAVAIIHGTTGTKVTLALTETDVYYYGEKLPKNNYHRKALGKVSYHPEFIFPTGKITNGS